MGAMVAQTGIPEAWFWGIGATVVGGVILAIAIKGLNWFPKSETRFVQAERRLDLIEPRMDGHERDALEMRRTLDQLDKGHDQLIQSINEMRVTQASQFATLKAGQEAQSGLMQSLIAAVHSKQEK